MTSQRGAGSFLALHFRVRPLDSRYHLAFSQDTVPEFSCVLAVNSWLVALPDIENQIFDKRVNRALGYFRPSAGVGEKLWARRTRLLFFDRVRSATTTMLGRSRMEQESQTEFITDCSQCPISRVTGHVVLGRFHLYDDGVYQDLGLLPVGRQCVQNPSFR